MAKRIIQQARGKGSSTYRVKRSSFRHRLKMPRNLEGEGKVIKLLSSAGHTTPLAKIEHKEGAFYIPAGKQMYEGQVLSFGKGVEVKAGNILPLSSIPVKSKVYLIESRPLDGGMFIRSGGASGTVTKVVGKDIYVMMPSKKEKKFAPDCRAVVGVVAGHGRTDKPVVKAGKKHHIKKAKSKLWPRTSAFKMNAIDHPFGSGRGKNPKSKIAKRNSPPGAKVGLLRPKRTGRKKR